MEIGKLISVDPRVVWQHEAWHFTPWLASQLDHLGEAIGDELELIGAETSVGPFSADIVARNARGETVLIENQLAKSDHTHLGQIMTYLAGLEAKTIVWVSTRFQAEHMSAMRWLNDHTPPEFRFFAAELRVVRIGDSPVAPIFDIVVRPNEFERDIRLQKAEAIAKSDGRNRDFWTAYLESYPQDAALGVKLGNLSNQRLSVTDEVLVGTWLAKTCGVYVRSRFSHPVETVVERLAPHADRLEALLGVPLQSGRSNEKTWLLVQQGVDIGDKAAWPAAMEWLHERTNATVDALRLVLVPEPEPQSSPEASTL